MCFVQETLAGCEQCPGSCRSHVNNRMLVLTCASLTLLWNHWCVVLMCSRWARRDVLWNRCSTWLGLTTVYLMTAVTSWTSLWRFDSVARAWWSRPSSTAGEWDTHLDWDVCVCVCACVCVGVCVCVKNEFSRGVQHVQMIYQDGCFSQQIFRFSFQSFSIFSLHPTAYML